MKRKEVSVSDLTESLERTLVESRAIKLNKIIDDFEEQITKLYEISMDSKYSREIFWSEKDQIFVVKIPELEFCATHGKTVVEAIINSEIAIKDWTDFAIKKGMEVTKPNSPKLSEDEEDILAYSLAIGDFRRNPRTYSMEEVVEELGLKNELDFNEETLAAKKES